jgi:hypothetical protein
VCFSATASFTAGVLVGGLGAASLPLVDDRRQWLFAALPLGFGIHQILEGVIWQQVEHSGGTPLRSPAVVAWLVFAWFLLPVWMPLSVYLFEPEERRRRWMLALAGVGAVTGAYLFVASLSLSAAVVVDQHHIEYQLPLHPGWLLVGPYAAATCLPLLLSSHRFVNRFGVAVTLSLGVAAVVAARQLSSVWCFFAAVLSVGLLWHYAVEHRRERWVGAPTA